VKFDELAKDFLTDYRVNGRKSLERAEISVKHLEGKFKGVRVVDITTAGIKTYVEERMKDEVAPATINRELAALKRMLKLGAQCTPPKVDRVPHIPMIKENNVRKGFFEHADFVALRDSLPSFLQGVLSFAYKTGWRKSEIMGLQWSQVDLENGVVRLNAGETKNDRARTIYLDDELKEIFQAQRKAATEAESLPLYVFTNETGTDRIKDFRKAWDTACKNLKIGGKLFHDLRRTAIRNMVRAGVQERVAMMISGHQTRSVFDRYNIVSDEDLKAAASKQESYLKRQKSQAGSRKIVTIV